MPSAGGQSPGACRRPAGFARRPLRREVRAYVVAVQLTDVRTATYGGLWTEGQAIRGVASAPGASRREKEVEGYRLIK